MATTDNTIASSDDAVTPRGLLRDYWKEALLLLGPKERQILEEARPEQFSAQSACAGGPVRQADALSDWPTTLLKACKKLESEYEGRRSTWHFCFLGRSIKVRDILDGFIKLLEKTKKIGDLASAADPVHAGLPWAFIRALLMLTTANSQQAGALYTGLEEVVRLLNRGFAYEAHIADAHLHRPGEQLKGFEEALIALYARIAGFLTSAHRIRKFNSFHKALHAFWKPEDIAEFQEDCQNLEEAISREAHLCNVFATQTLQRALAEISTGTNIITNQLSETKDHVRHILQHCDRSKRIQVLNWASVIAIVDHHELARKDRTPKTCDWILNTDEFRSWCQADAPLLFWLHGNPGAGKTKLVSRIVDCFQKPGALDEATEEGSEPRDSVSKCGLAYFYCLKTADERCVAENILASIVKQLAAQDDFSFSALLRVYNKKEECGFMSSRFTIDESRDLIKEMSACFPGVIIIVDALDECNEETRGELLTAFNDIHNAGVPVKVLISSRPDPDIRMELEERLNRSILATDNSDDIMEYTRERLRQFQTSKKAMRHAKAGFALIPASLEDRIVSNIRERSDGMFLYAKLHLDHLLSLDRRSAIENALEALPRGLLKTFDEILGRIDSSDNDLREIALKSLQWILGQNGAADAWETLAAVCYDVEGTNDAVQFDVSTDTLLKACQHLVILVPDTAAQDENREPKDRFYFVHLSVQEYCIAHRWGSADIHSFAAKICLNHLLSPPDEDAEKCKSGYGLTLYSKRTWAFHAQKLEGTGQVDPYVISAICRFTEFPGKLSAHAKSLYSSGSVTKLDLLSKEGVKYQVNPSFGEGDYHSLPFICFLGLESVLQSTSTCSGNLPCLEFNQEPKPLSGYLSPSTTPQVLRRVLDILALDNYITVEDILWYILALTSERSSLWLDHWFSCCESSITEAEWLPDLIQAVFPSYGATDQAGILGAITSIAVISTEKYMDSLFLETGDHAKRLNAGIKSLLQRGANIDFEEFCRPSGYYWPRPLAEAVRCELDETVSLLIQHCPTIRLPDLVALFGGIKFDSVYYPTPADLRRASITTQFFSNRYGFHRLESISRHLIAFGELRVEDTDLTTLIHSDAGGTKLDSLLDITISFGATAMTKLLLRVLERSPVPVTLSDNCLIAAAGAPWVGEDALGPVEICRLLMKRGLDVGTKLTSGRHRTALTAACAVANLEICQLLLQNGVDVKQERDALPVACGTGYIGICRLLLDSGADPMQKPWTEGYGSALTMACSRGHLDIVDLLLQRGAPVKMVANAGPCGY